MSVRIHQLSALEAVASLKGAVTGWSYTTGSGIQYSVEFAPQEPKLDTPAQQAAPTAFAGKEPAPVLNWGVGRGKSLAVPAYEILGEEILLNRFDHYATSAATYPSLISNFENNVHKRWVVDNDKFATNQFLHPYQGTIYQGFARSAGLGFWESFAYTMGGSLLWEYAGESTTPSINDQVATGIGGVFFGEPLFRMAGLLLETSDTAGLDFGVSSAPP